MVQGAREAIQGEEALEAVRDRSLVHQVRMELLRLRRISAPEAAVVEVEPTTRALVETVGLELLV